MKKKQERLDRIMGSCCERMQEEVSALLGKDVTFAQPETRVLSKEDFFSEPAGKSVLAHVKMDGEIEGEGCLLVRIADAIRIGGTLIMLPESELENVIAEESYTEELKDSYGEIANIICGSLTVTFEEQFPKAFRLIRMEQEVILPVKVDVESDEPVPDGMYYLMTSSMSMGDAEMGMLHLLLPAASFGLVPETVPEVEEKPKPEDEAAPVVDESDSGSGEVEQVETLERSPVDAEEAKPLDRPEKTEEQAAQPAAQPKSTAKDLKKQKKLIDQLLKTSLERIGEEVGALLGGSLKIRPLENEVYHKEDFLDQAGSKKVMARMDVRGEGSGESYLFVDLKDAILLGGTLIMLPDAELEEVIRNEEFGEDAQDAYGEVSNIIAGVYTAIFEEQYRKNLGFVKTALETIVPVKIDADSDEVFPNQAYYLSSGELLFNEQQLGRFQAMFPVSLFELEALVQQDNGEEGDEGVESASNKEVAASGDQSERQKTDQQLQGVQSVGIDRGVDAATLSSEMAEVPDILLFTDDDAEAESIAGILRGHGYIPRILHYRDQVGAYLTPSISLVLLVMKEVNEQGFGMAIKLGSGGLQVPLVASAPAWTRSMVLKAVKYGATDILITPASSEDIKEKLETNLVKKAA